MYELIKVTDKCGYFQSPAKIGLILTGGCACLIDSGNDKDAGKKVKRILDAEGLTLSAIYNTHYHADHTGGNRYLQDNTGCKIYAAGIERDFTEHPILEPSYLFGGNPPAELRHKFLMAQPCRALPLEDGSLPEGVSAIPLPGHSWDMVGFRTDEDAVFLADCLSSEETLQKYGITFITDVEEYLKTLEKVKDMRAAVFIPSHAQATADIAPLAQLNIDKVNEIADVIIKICKEGVSFETLLSRLFCKYGLTMTFEQYALAGSTVRSYLTWLKDGEILQAIIENNSLIWKA